MQPYLAASHKVEVTGETVLSIVKGMMFGEDRAQRVLAAHGIRDPQPGIWYRQQDWLDAFQEIAQTLGPNTLFSIGQKIPEQAKFPPSIDTLEKGLAAIDVAYQMNHRGGPIGSYRFVPAGERRALIICDNPYPSDFDRGIITAMANRMKPAGSFVSVALDPERPTRKSGGETCTFVITW